MRSLLCVIVPQSYRLMQVDSIYELAYVATRVTSHAQQDSLFYPVNVIPSSTRLPWSPNIPTGSRIPTIVFNTQSSSAIAPQTYIYFEGTSLNPIYKLTMLAFRRVEIFFEASGITSGMCVTSELNNPR